MQIPDKILKYLAVAMFVCMLLLVAVFAVKRASYESEVTRLQNEVAARDATIETAKQVYSKLALETQNLQGLLSSKDDEIKSLMKTIKARDEDLLVANNLVVYWKKKFEATGGGTQTNVGERIKVEFSKDFGYIKTTGFTLTDPPEFFVSVEQNRPLKMTLVVGQLNDGSWKADVTSSEENVGVDISVAAVNPRVLAPKWYEGFGVNMDVGVGPGMALVGIGASYKISNFEVGPKVWIAAPTLDVVYGANITWHPFSGVNNNGK